MPDLEKAFTQLVAILRPYASKLEIQKDTPSELYVDTRY